MPRGPAPGWRTRKQPVVDDYILASVTQAGRIGIHIPESGHFADLVIKVFATKDDALEWHRALYRCAHFLIRTGQAPLSMSAKIERDGTGYRIRFKAVDKTLARKHVLEKYGPDRSKWPYDPRRRGA